MALSTLGPGPGGGAPYQPLGGGGGAGCSRARILKVLLALVATAVLCQYIVLQDTVRPEPLFTASNNSTIIRNPQVIQWPKRTQSKHCFDGDISSNSNSEPSTNSTPTAANVSETADTKTTANSEGRVNVHNSAKRVSWQKMFANTTAAANTSVTERSNDTAKTNDDGALVSSQIVIDTTVETLNDSERKGFGCDVPCPAIPPGLDGPIDVNSTDVTLKDVENNHIDVAPGGRFAPRTCKPKDKVAIVIPYRDREAHLAMFLNNIHPFLMKQQIDYQIFIVEQKGKGKFNRASLMNVGFVEAIRMRKWDCFIFHDVDLLPLDDRNLYTCPSQPRHLSAAIDKFQFKLPYKAIFGGVSALTTAQFKKVNGFSNSFWGWGGEDDDMANRIHYHNFHISRYPMSIARYTMLDHEKEKPNQERYNLLMKGKRLFNTDGLKNLRYTLVETQFHRLYTLLLVELHPPS